MDFSLKNKGSLFSSMAPLYNIGYRLFQSSLWQQ